MARRQCNAEQQGPRGPKGALRTEALVPGRTQPSSEPIMAAGIDELTLLVAPPADWLEDLIQDTKVKFATSPGPEGKLAQIKRLEWLQKVVAAGQSIETSDVGLARYNNINLSIGSILNYAEMGLDIFGRSHNLTTLLAPEYIKSFLDYQVTSINKLEEAQVVLAARESGQSAQLAALRETYTTLDASIRHDEARITSIVRHLDTLQDEIKKMLEELGPTWIEIFEADNAFRVAVARQGGCEFGKIVQFVAIVATVASTGGAALGAVGALTQAVSGVRTLNMQAAGRIPNTITSAGIRSDFQEISRIMSPAGKSISEFRASLADTERQIREYQSASRPSNRVPEVPSDYAKLLANKADFDRELEPFMRLPEAREYRRLMNKFIATMEARNNKIVEHAANLASLQEILVEQDSRRTSAAQIAQMTAAGFDSNISEKVRFLARHLTSMKIFALRQIVDLYRSIEYVSLEARYPVIQSLEGPFLTAALTQAEKDYYEVVSKLGQPLSPTASISVPLETLLSDNDLAALAAGSAVTFAVPSDLEGDPFKVWYAVQTAGIMLKSSDGTPLDREFTLVFENQGRSLVFDERRTPRLFTHAVIVRGNFAQDDRGAVSSHGFVSDDSNRFIGVGPYGPWRILLMAKRPFEPQDLRRASLVFAIRGRTAPISRPSPG